MRHLLRAAVAATALFAFGNPASAHQAVDKKILDLIENDDAAVPDKSTAARIRRGRNLFLNEIFGGNGRTCGTCHEPTASFTINPAFIATLPQSSPLFVAENNPALVGLEDPALLRQGLICENIDRFPVPNTLPSTATCVFRTIPHTLALRTSVLPRDDFPLVNATGWSGDGSPGDGSLRNFAVGAVVQHFPKNQQRRPGIDFQVPTKNQLADMLAFQQSLGRQSDVSLDGDEGKPALVFADPSAEAGKRIFVNGVPGRNGTIRSCNGCHDDAGANDANGDNRQFNTGVALRSTAPACLSTVAPGDGGFGATPVVTRNICNPVRTVVFRGDGTFNTPPIVEAADTEPFFHNGVATTLRDAILHYTTDEFNQSPAGGGNAFVLNADQVNQIEALLRALNARENVRNSIVVSTRAAGESQPLGAASIREARSEVLDALRVLQQAPVPLYSGTSIVALLTQAQQAQLQAISQNGAQRRSSLNTAIARLRAVQPQFTQ